MLKMPVVDPPISSTVKSMNITIITQQNNITIIPKKNKANFIRVLTLRNHGPQDVEQLVA